MKFKQFRNMFQAHVASILEDQNNLFMIDLDKDILWDTYLASFPSGANEIFRKRGAFDCSCCRSFIRQFANVVTIKDNKLVSIWDFQTNDTTYQPVIDTLSSLVKSAAIKDVLVTKERAFGTDYNHEQFEDNSIQTWSHFRIELPKRFVTKSDKSEASLMGSFRDVRNVFERSLEELSQDSIETILDLITERSLYKGEEWQGALLKFLDLHKTYHTLPDDEKSNFCWITSVSIGGAIGKIRNHSIGVLLQDISKGIGIEKAVRKYETVIVPPENYKRPKLDYSAKQTEQAEAMVIELGLENSLGRRHAKLDDIRVTNVIWANRDAAKVMDGLGGVFESLRQDIPEDPKKFERVVGIGIEDFIANILPNAKNIGILLENKHEDSLVSLIAPILNNNHTLFKWNNSFSWAYKGNVTDSLKQRVKAAGGSVTGALRFSLQWNSAYDNLNDFDAHCIEPNGNIIYFPNAGRSHSSSGILDVDIVNPKSREVAVENITWSNHNKIQNGIHHCLVHNYTHRGGRSGFEAEIEFAGQIYEYNYTKELAQGEKVTVAKFIFNRDNGIEFIESLPSVSSSRDLWGLKTNQFHPVSSCMFSPNYWDNQQGVGHKHYLFMLAGCINQDRPNGFFNEYLREEFMEYKKVFAALGNKMKVAHSDTQLSGIGFSSTKRNSVICKVDNKIIKIIF